MPSPVPDTHRPAAVTDQSDSDHQSLDDDEEYEEIEVEEETEVEEDETEVEDNNDNDDDDDDDFGEDLSPVNQDHTHGQYHVNSIRPLFFFILYVFIS